MIFFIIRDSRHFGTKLGRNNKTKTIKTYNDEENFLFDFGYGCNGSLCYR